MVNHCEVPVIFQDNEHQLGKIILRYFFMGFKFLFCSRRTKITQQQKYHDVLMLFLLIMWTIVLLQDNPMLLCVRLESLIELFTFHNSK